MVKEVIEMPLMPKRTKYRKPHRIYHEGKAKGNTELHFGEYGLQAKEGAWITNRQIEAAHIILAKYTRKIGKNYIRIFPYLGITKKQAEVRMGNGKGTVEGWFAVVEKGQVLFEVSGVDESVANHALRQAGWDGMIDPKGTFWRYVKGELVQTNFTKDNRIKK